MNDILCERCIRYYLGVLLGEKPIWDTVWLSLWYAFHVIAQRVSYPLLRYSHHCQEVHANADNATVCLLCLLDFCSRPRWAPSRISNFFLKSEECLRSLIGCDVRHDLELDHQEGRASVQRQKDLDRIASCLLEEGAQRTLQGPHPQGS